ncbi:hypothetical protein EON63_01830 [archaeon]|nr:MAG: hypothetical protein EON63_01830 [archaeon]
MAQFVSKIRDAFQNSQAMKIQRVYRAHQERKREHIRSLLREGSSSSLHSGDFSVNSLSSLAKVSGVCLCLSTYVFFGCMCMCVTLVCVCKYRVMLWCMHNCMCIGSFVYGDESIPIYPCICAGARREQVSPEIDQTHPSNARHPGQDQDRLQASRGMCMVWRWYGHTHTTLCV